MGRRFPLLDERAYNPESGGYIHDSMARTYAVAESERGGAVLLAVPVDCMVSEATVLDQPAGVCWEIPSILRGILRGVCSGMGGVRIGVVSAEEEERLPGFGRRR